MSHEQDNPNNEMPDPMYSLAQELQYAFDGKLNGDEVATSTGIDQAFDHAFAEVAPGILRPKLEGLPPAEFAKVYVRLLGDTAFRALVDDIAATKMAQLQRESRLLKLSHEATVTGALSLEDLLPDEIIRIGLFGKDEPRYAAKRYIDNAMLRPLHRIVTLKSIEPSAGRVQVVADNWVGPIWKESDKTEQIPPMTLATINPTLQLHAPIAFHSDEHGHFLPTQIIGYIESNDGTLLLDGRVA